MSRVALRRIQRQWEFLASRDPLWAILTDESKKNGGWDEGEFFETGAHELAWVVEYLKARYDLPRWRKALDFGCGVGRLTQAMTRYFGEVYGVDISAPMIEQARRYDRHPEKCRYVLNSRSDLRIFPDGKFDFIYSVITLQHMPPRMSKRYLSEFLRVLAPGGAAVFQLPARPVKEPTLLSRLASPVHFLMRRWVLDPNMEMHGIAKDTVIQIVEAQGGRVLEAIPDSSPGPAWESYRYLAIRPE